MKTGEHIIIDFAVENCENISKESEIDNFLYEVTRLVGMTLAVPPISLKFPVDTSVIHNCEHSLDVGHLTECQKKSILAILSERAKSGNLGGCGVSGTAIWVESHCAVHTWTELKFVTVDMFSCAKLDLQKVLEFAKRYFTINGGRYLKITRFTDKAPVIEKGAL